MTMSYSQIARICHEVNKSICECNNDHSQQSWEDAEEWQRESAIAGVEYRFKNPLATPADQHAAWMSDKIAAGWTYDRVKNAEAKTHPCLVPYEQLPFDQRVKDHAFAAIVKSCQ